MYKLNVRIILLIILPFTINAQTSIPAVTAQALPNQLVVPASASVQIIFSEGDSILAPNGQWAFAKGSHDMTVPYLLQKKQVQFAISHECNDSSALLGDGGGITTLSISKMKHKVLVHEKRAIDFSPVGGTYNNCSGTYVSSTGKILTAEEGYPESNVKLHRSGKGYTDTSDFNGMTRTQHTGWMVEVDPVSGKAIQKIYSMGRFGHEHAQVQADNKTVYLTDDFAPGVFFKFIATQPNDFSSGQLYAFKQKENQYAGEWIPLPMEIDSLINIRSIALNKGATFFMRMEWMALHDGKLYITETGFDALSLYHPSIGNGKPAYHLKPFTNKDTISYPHGGVLLFDPETNTILPYLLGGKSTTDSVTVFSNPDAITVAIIDKKPYLILCEDIIGLTYQRVSKEALKMDQYVCEVYVLPLLTDKSIRDIEELRRIAVLPAGSEGSGPFWWNDTLFLNVQHPDRKNPTPYNKSCTVAIRF